MLDTFLEELGRTSRAWRLVGHKIRLYVDYCPRLLCPIEAVAHAKNGPKQPRLAVINSMGKLVGLSEVESTAVVLAADNFSDCDPVVRLRLMEACGIGPQKPGR